MLPIVILTYRRTELQRTWLAIAPELRHNIVFVVRADEAEIIAVKYAPSKVDVLPDWVQNVAQTRQWIWDKYSVLHDGFYQLDDDIQYFSAMMRRKDDPSLPRMKHRPEQTWYCPTLTSDAEAQRKMFATLEAEIATGVGVTSPRPNWTFPSPEDKVYPRTSTAFVTGFYLINSKILRPLNLRWDRWNSAGDLDFLFQILGHGIDCTFRTDFMYNIDQSLDSSIHTEENREFYEFLQHWQPYTKKKVTMRKDMDPRSWRAKYGAKLEGRGSLSFSRAKLFKDAPLKDPNSQYHNVLPAPPYITPEEIVVQTFSLNTDVPEHIPHGLRDGEFRGHRYIYALIENGKAFYVGDTNDPRERFSSHVYDAKHPERAPTEAVKYMREELRTRDMDVTIDILEEIQVLAGEDGGRPTTASLAAETRWISDLRAAGDPIVNRKQVEPRGPKQKKTEAVVSAEKIFNGKGGGWQIKAEWYGKGMTIRCKEPLDGSFWECDHDALADVVNASLKAKGKTILGEPGPSQRQYGSSSGLREPSLWHRV